MSIPWTIRSLTFKLIDITFVNIVLFLNVSPMAWVIKTIKTIINYYGRTRTRTDGLCKEAYCRLSYILCSLRSHMRSIKLKICWGYAENGNCIKSSFTAEHLHHIFVVIWCAKYAQIKKHCKLSRKRSKWNIGDVWLVSNN